MKQRDLPSLLDEILNEPDPLNSLGNYEEGEELSPLISIARSVNKVLEDETVSREAARVRTRARFQAAASVAAANLQAQAQNQAVNSPVKPTPKPILHLFPPKLIAPLRGITSRTWLVRAAVILFVLGLTFFQVSQAAAQSLPNDFTYPLKTNWEDFHYNITSDQLNKVELDLTVSERRVFELNTLHAKHRPLELGIFNNLNKHLSRASQLVAHLSTIQQIKIATKLANVAKSAHTIVQDTKSSLTPQVLTVALLVDSSATEAEKVAQPLLNQQIKLSMTATVSSLTSSPSLPDPNGTGAKPTANPLLVAPPLQVTIQVTIQVTTQATANLLANPTQLTQTTGANSGLTSPTVTSVDSTTQPTATILAGLPTVTSITGELHTVTPRPGATYTPTDTRVASSSSTDTPRPDSTHTPVPTDTRVASSTDTPRPDSTHTPVPTDTRVVATPTDTALATPTIPVAPTNTTIAVPTSTLVPTLPIVFPTSTNTAVPTPTNTAVPTPTNTAVPTPTNTAVPTPTNTAVPTPTDTAVPTPTDTPTDGKPTKSPKPTKEPKPTKPPKG